MMFQVPRRLWLTLAMFPGAAFALGLGEVRNVSPLNQPLSAEIPIIAAAPDELDSLRAAIASREEFARLGLERPGFLSTVAIKLVKGKGGEPYLELHSAERVTEPFVTLLVEAGWNRGRLVREYTLLLDPPVYRDAPARSAPVVVAPAVVAPVRTPAPPAASASPAPGAAPVSAPATGELAYGETYRVRSSDSALRIARKLGATGRGEIDQIVVALFQQNPGAFAGNINRLRAGATVRLPTRDEVASLPLAAARREVAAQYAAARAAAEARAAAAAEGSAPEASAATAPAKPAPVSPAPVAPAATKPAAAASATGRLRLVTPGAAPAPAVPAAAPAPAPAPVSAASPVSPEAAPEAATAPAGDRVAQLESELEETRRLLQLQNEQLARLQRGGTAAAGANARSPAAPAATAEEESFLDAVGGLPTLLLGGAFLLLAGGLGYGFVRRRREAAADEFAVDEAPAAREDFFQTTGTLPAPARPAPSHMEVLERPVTETSPPVVRPRPAARNADDTLSGESAIDLDKADALTEANWHIAYGLYDQAADTLLAALRQTPERRDLKLKLAEVYFAWGKPDRFLELARELGQHRAAGDAAEWDNIVIMGRQLAPQDPLFAGASAKPSRAAVDLDLEGGQGKVDVDLFAAPVPGVPEDDLLDFDLEGALASSASETGTRLQPVWRGDSPTLEQPALKLPEPTLRQKVDLAIAEAAAKPGSSAAEGGLEATAEMSLDDLNLDLHLDLGDADQAGGADFPDLSPLEETVQPGSLSSAADPAPTATVLMEELPMASVEPVTLSEVGTKLDLARAYMDMGDPEGARSILQEVVTEGSPGQQQEAKRLLASLPG